MGNTVWNRIKTILYLKETYPKNAENKEDVWDASSISIMTIESSAQTCECRERQEKIKI